MNDFKIKAEEYQDMSERLTNALLNLCHEETRRKGFESENQRLRLELRETKELLHRERLKRD